MCAVVRRKSGDEKMLGRKKPKMLALAALFGCFIMTINVYTMVKPYVGPLPVYYDMDSSKNRITPKMTNSKLNDHLYKMSQIISKYSNNRTNAYEIKGDLRIIGTSSTIYMSSSHHQNSTCWNIKPYPRKDNLYAMEGIKNFKIITTRPTDHHHCSQHHTNIPAILFSVGGFAASNHFHTFADVLVPLFLTSHHFNRAVIFLVSGYTHEWILKYGEIMEKLTKYHIYDIDKQHEALCFSRMIIGLKALKDLEFVSLHSSPFSRRSFAKLFELDILPMHGFHQPRMLIISRKGSRKVKNEREVGNLARRLGFEVVVKELSSNVSLNAQIVNYFDVMVGVHGAGLSNLVFLRENAVVVQIIPFGLEYLARVCFEGGIGSNKLKYLRYSVSLNESSLLGRYPPNSKIYTNPKAVSNDFQYFDSVYVQNQDVNLDLNRFRETILIRALKLVGR